jgi:P27 family predicted phage terminase small subunit
MARGRPRVPDEQKKAAGTYRNDLANLNAPVYPVAAPERPAWLSPEAAEEWDRLIPILLEKRVLAEVDLGVAASYCANLGELRLAHETLKTEPRFYEVGTGQRKEHPASKAARDLGNKIRLLASELGLSPAARAKVSAVAPELRTAGAGSPADPMAPEAPRTERKRPASPIN